jgi:hypothetical protein
MLFEKDSINRWPLTDDRWLLTEFGIWWMVYGILILPITRNS